MKPLLALLALLLFVSCERQAECRWCTTVAILPYCDTIIGQGYACGDDIDIILARQTAWKDLETGEVYLVMTICELSIVNNFYHQYSELMHQIGN